MDNTHVEKCCYHPPEDECLCDCHKGKGFSEFYRIYALSKLLGPPPWAIPAKLLDIYWDIINDLPM
jgi:hypothetical protein